MVKKITLIGLFVLGLLFSGCVNQPKPLYNYGNYNESYYVYKKDLNAESMLALQKSIEEAIKNAGESTAGRVPPGMYANLGYIYLKNGKGNEAIANFEKEKAIYPEAVHFMDRMIKKSKLAMGEDK